MINRLILHWIHIKWDANKKKNIVYKFESAFFFVYSTQMQTVIIFWLVYVLDLDFV